MNYLLVAFALVTAAAVVAVLLKRSASRSAAPAPSVPRRPSGARPVATEASKTASGAPSIAEADPAWPAALSGFRFNAAQEIADERRAAYVATFREVPRPPKLLHHLLSPEFLESADSAQLVELINAEPLIAAKVLTTVNSPLYGLKSPVTSVGQAVTYLGLNVVRTVCLQYILISAFHADSFERKQLLEQVWRASSLASELAQQLCRRLEMPEPGLTVSAVVLSFLGWLATAATMPRALLTQIPRRDLLARASAEQERMGLASSEIGRLLMAHWGLPERLVADAADIDKVLVTPPEQWPTERAPRLGMAYLCARLGEKLAAGEMHDLQGFDPTNSGDVEFLSLRAYLRMPRFARLADQLHSQGLGVDLQRILKA